MTVFVFRLIEMNFYLINNPQPLQFPVRKCVFFISSIVVSLVIPMVFLMWFFK